MFVDWSKLKQFEIYYLLIHVDGSPSLTEANYLTDILMRDNPPEVLIKAFQAFCERMSLKLSNAAPDAVIAELDYLLNGKSSSTTSKTVAAEKKGLPNENHLPGALAQAMIGATHLPSKSYSAANKRPFERDKATLIQTIWTLINLSYADGDYSDAEKQFVNHLVERWKMDPALVAEFTDTASTILALTLQKEWIQNTSKPYEVIQRTVQELDRSIASMADNLNVSISEADIA